MLFHEDLSPNLVNDIVALQSSKGKVSAPDIERILATTRNAPTMSYGLRVLSELGYSEAQLLAMAMQYNKRIRQETDRRTDAWLIDPPVISRFYVRTERLHEHPEGYRQITVHQ